MTRLRSALLLLTPLLFTGCGDDQRAADTTPTMIYRRNDVPFTNRLDALSEPTLEQSKRIDEIERLINEDATTQAEIKLDEYLAGGGTHPRAYFLKGRLHFMHGAWSEAIPWLEQAVERSPSYIEPRLMLAQCFLKEERMAAAESVYAELDRLLPKAPWGPYGMALVKRRRGDDAGATALTDEALGRDPNHAPGLRLRAELAHAANQPALEEQMLLRYVAEDPDAAAAWFRLGELATSANRAQDARRHCERSYEIAPLPSTARRLAELAEASGDHAQARRWQVLAGIDGPAPVEPAAK